MGGSFKDGALAGFAGALGQQVAGQMLQGIDAAVDAGTMTPIEAAAARTFARMLGSAIRASATPGDPNQAFASAFLGDVMGTIEVRQAGQPGPALVPINQTTFDDNGRALPVFANPVTPMPAVALPVAAPLAPSDPFSVISSDDEVSYGDRLADQMGVPREDLVDAGLRDYLGRSAQVFEGFIEGAGFSVLDTGHALLEIAKSPGQFIDGVKLLLNSAEARAQLGPDMVARVKVDVQMLEDAFHSGDLRGIGQQVGKLVVDFAQIATEVEALTRLGISTASAGGRIVLGAAELMTARVGQIRSMFAGVQMSDEVAIRIASNFGREGDAFTAAAEQMVAARNSGWVRPSGETWYPAAYAVPGTEFQTVLKPGMHLDRYGGTGRNSSFLAPVESGLGQRALPPGTNIAIRDEYVVLKAFPVEQSNVMPWFGKPGMGVQFNTQIGADMNIQQLIKLGFIKAVKP